MPQMVQELICQPGGLREVPSRFIQPVEERPQQHSENPHLSFPVIDMEGSREHVVTEIARACEQWGFFQVINHGVAPSLMEAFRDVACEFFSLSQQEKDECAVSQGRVLATEESTRRATESPTGQITPSCSVTEKSTSSPIHVRLPSRNVFR